jgi:putative oxidoreductase
MIRLLINQKSFSTPVNVGVLLLRVYTPARMLTHGGSKIMRLLDGNLKFGGPLGIGSEFSLLLAHSQNSFVRSLSSLVWEQV